MDPQTIFCPNFDWTVQELLTYHVPLNWKFTRADLEECLLGYFVISAIS
jgi:hypothetical protein